MNLKSKPTGAKKASTKEPSLSVLPSRDQNQAEWEQSIAYLFNLSASVDKVETTVEKERIAYLISAQGTIIPRLQISKDGVIWSKKKDLKLASFRQLCIPCMNEMDRRMAGLVRSSGRGSRTTYELGGAKMMAELIGCPLLFSYENPDKQVTIVKDQPCLTVTKTPDGYHVDANVEYPATYLDMIMQKDDP